MKGILVFLTDILSQPAILLGIVSFMGLVALKKPGHKILTGTLGPILGYIMLGAGADFIVSNLTPLGQMIEKGFKITGVVPNNEAVVATAQNLLGRETMLILVAGLFVNLIVAKFTKYKYAISPAIGQKYTLKVTDGEEIAMGHFGSLGYYISSWIGKKVGNPENTTENMEIPEKWGFLRNTTIATAITMIVFYLIAGIAAGSEFVSTLSDGVSPYLYVVMLGLKFAVGVAIVYNGVRMILADLIPAFQGIATKIIPNSIPAVDCAVFFTFAQTAVIIGFIFSFIGGIIGMIILGISGGVLIIPGLVPHFFCGATAGIYGNATGGKKGAMLGAFVNGLLLSFLPAALLPVLGKLGFANTTFGDVDFTVIGILLGTINNLIGRMGIYTIMLIIVIILIIPNFLKTKSEVINNIENE